METKKTVVWKPVEYEGIEHLTLDDQQTRSYTQSVVIGVNSQSAFRLDYSVICDRNYAVTEVIITQDPYITPFRTLYMTSDGQGNWFDTLKHPLTELDGCIDVDISATPFTNTLPIRRIQWQVGQSEVFKMVYILIPDLTVSVMRQRYTCLEKGDQFSIFRYENVDDDFKAEITVDSAGLVVHYPGLFERVV